jgi:serine protease inhibitor
MMLRIVKRFFPRNRNNLSKFKDNLQLNKYEELNEDVGKEYFCLNLD